MRALSEGPPPPLECVRGLCGIRLWGFCYRAVFVECWLVGLGLDGCLARRSLGSGISDVFFSIGLGF